MNIISMTAARVTLLDADALAVAAARINVADAFDVLLSDAWTAVPKDSHFDIIVSNPPVHRGRCQDFSVLEALLSGARSHLADGGAVYFVTQSYVPAAMVSSDVGGATVVRDTDKSGELNRIFIARYLFVFPFVSLGVIQHTHTHTHTQARFRTDVCNVYHRTKHLRSD